MTMIDKHRIHLLDGSKQAWLEDLAPALAIAGDARVVALGEGAHFVNEYWTSRQQLIRFLHERAGFGLVAMEIGIGEALDLVGWINGADTTDDLGSVSPAATEWGAADTMRFLRAYNTAALARGNASLKFAGLDLPSAGGSFRPALDPLTRYIRAVDPGLAPLLKHVRAITDRVDAGSAVKATTIWSELRYAERDAVLSDLTRVTLRMSALQPHYHLGNGPIEHRTALRLAESALTTAYVLQSAHDTAGGAGLDLDTTVRERFLADSVLALMERSDDKIIVVAHNNHIQKTPVAFAGKTYTLPMGLHLAQRLGDDYCAIGQTTTDDHGPDMVPDSDSPVGFRVLDQELPPPPEGSIEQTLITMGVGEHPALVDVRAGPGLSAINAMRSQGAYVDTDVSAAFDAVINHPRISRQTDLGF